MLARKYRLLDGRLVVDRQEAGGLLAKQMSVLQQSVSSQPKEGPAMLLEGPCLQQQLRTL